MSSRPIPELGFKSSVRPELGFEIMKYSQLLRRPLSNALPARVRSQFFLVYYGLHGHTRHHVDFVRCSIRPHDVAFVVPGRVQAFDPTPGLEMWLVLFTPEFLKLSVDPRTVDPLRSARVLSPFFTPPTLHVPAAARAELLELVGQLRAEYERPADAVQTSLLSSLLRALLLKLERLAGAPASGAVPEALDAFRALLEARHAETRSVDWYAREVGLTPRALGQLTHRHFGRSAKQYVDERVALELKRLLVHTDLSVKELSARFGFDEPTNLVKFFRRHAGTTPLAFRAGASR